MTGDAIADWENEKMGVVMAVVDTGTGVDASVSVDD